MNSILHFAYQRTYGASWVDVASPSSVNLTETIPAGMEVKGIKDLVTGSAVSYTVGSGTYTYPIADNPVEVSLGPTTVTARLSGWQTDYGRYSRRDAPL